MRRYNPIHPARAMREIDSGEYVRYDDAQADKADALKEKDAEIEALEESLGRALRKVAIRGERMEALYK